MNYRQDPQNRGRAAGHTAAHTADSTSPLEHIRTPWRGRMLLGELARGCTFGGMAILLSWAPLGFGACPLGLALLSASSVYTLYIFAGLIIGACLSPVTLSTAGWVAVYALCVVLRAVVRTVIDPPTLPDGSPCRGRRYLTLWRDACLRRIGFMGEHGSGEPLCDPAASDYYAGAGTSRQKRNETEATPNGGERTIHLFAEHPFLRMLTAAVCGFIAGTIGLISQGFHFYDLMGLFILLVATPLCTFMLVSVFGESGLILFFSPAPLRDAPLREHALRGHSISDRDGGASRVAAHFHPLTLSSVCVLCAAVTFAAHTCNPRIGALTLSLATLLALLFSLSASARLGVVPGVAAAVLCGLAADPRSAPIFILAAGGYALLRYLSHRAGIMGGCTIGAIWCVLVEGVPSLIFHLPSILLTIPLYLLWERLCDALPVAGARPRDDSELEAFTASVTAALSAETRAEAQRARLTALSEAFGALSRRLYNLSGQLRRPRMADVKRLCDEAFGRRCARCRRRESCWGDTYDRTTALMAHLAERLHAAGVVQLEDVPDGLSDFCPHLTDIIDDINARYARLCETLSRSEKTEVFAADYAAISALLSDALESDRLEAEAMADNRAAADRIFDYLSGVGVTVQGVVVSGRQDSGRRRVIVRGAGFDDMTDPPEEMKARIEGICGARLGLPRFEQDEHAPAGVAVMTLSAEAKLTARYAGSTVPAGADKHAPLPSPLTDKTPAGGYEPPAVCGDHIALFKSDDAYFYALISDGMGSGEDASLTSDICTMFLERMLSAGNRVEISLKMLDGYLHAKNSGTGDECSATVDLMELDMMDGHALFAKNGAAPTYVVREGVVYKLRSRSMPIGILRDTPPELLRFRMHPGDVVVMVSDGVTQGQDECPWLIDLLSTPMPENMDALRTDIIRRALSSGSEDDLSAIAIRVEDAV